MKIFNLIALFFCLTGTAKAQDSEKLMAVLKLMQKEKVPEKNELTMYRAIKELKLNPVKNAEEIDMLKGQLAMSYLTAKNFSKFESFIRQISNKFNQTSYLNMGADFLYRQSADLNYAEIIAKRTIDLYESYKNNPMAKPADFPLEDWNRFMTMAAYPYHQSYASILYKNGHYKKALFYQEMALKGQDLKKINPQIIDTYTILLEKDNQFDKAYDLLLSMAKTGRTDEKMNARLEKMHTKKYGNDDDAKAFLTSIHKNVKQLYQLEVAKKLIKDVEAPDFNLLDLSGKRVSLSDFSGKIVILDFWATWCAPCIASMPTMAQLSKKYPNVVFLFIATQESGKDAVKQVKTFIEKNKLEINVLMDVPTATNLKLFPVAKAYQLSGIPAKMVIDKKGQLRFKTEGFSTESELIHELEAMIAIANELTEQQSY